MRSIIRLSNSRLWAVALAALPAAGCSEMINPWRDDTPRAADVSTPSTRGLQASGVAAAQRSAGYEPQYVPAQDGTVAHWPLWWEDPFVDKGSEDDHFAWTEEDYIAMPYGLGRFILNTMGWPVSAVMTPPWVVMGSDGVLSRQALGYDHDAERLPGGVEPPIDVLEVGTVPEDEPPTPARDAPGPEDKDS